MKPLLVALSALLLLTPAFARRAMRRTINTPTGVKTAAPELRAWGTGFAVRDGRQITGYDALGKNPVKLVEAKGDLTEWTTSPGSLHIAWVEAGKVHVTTASVGTDRELGACDSGLAFSHDDKVLAWISQGNVVLHDVAGDRKRVIEPRMNRVLEGAPVFTGDGKRLLIATTHVPVKTAALDGTIDSADPAAEAPEFTEMHGEPTAFCTMLVASPDRDLVAWVERGADATKGTLRVFDSAAEDMHDYTVTGDIREISLGSEKSPVVYVRGAGEPAIREQQLVRSGTSRVFWSEALTLPGSGEVLHLVERAGGKWFLRKMEGAAEYEVVKAEIR